MKMSNEDEEDKEKLEKLGERLLRGLKPLITPIDEWTSGAMGRWVVDMEERGEKITQENAENALALIMGGVIAQYLLDSLHVSDKALDEARNILRDVKKERGE